MDVWNLDQNEIKSWVREKGEFMLGLCKQCSGDSLNIFNHQTNVDVDNRFAVYEIRDLGAELSPITMLVMMESIQQRIVENGKRGKATWLHIDEFHVILNSEYLAKYLQ